MFTRITGNRQLLVRLGIAALLGVAAGWLLACAWPPGQRDVVATVNGKRITRQAFFAQLEQDAGETTLDRLIAEELVLGYRKVQIGEVEIEEELARIRSNYADEDTFEEALARYQLTPERLQREVRMKLILEHLASAGVTVSDEEVQAFFQANKEHLGTPAQVKASHILVDSKAEADKLLALLKGGADFAALAKEHSKDGNTAAAGGDLGYLELDDQLLPEFRKALSSLRAGQTSAPVKTDFGYHIIRATDRREAKPADFAAQEKDIRAYLVEQKSRSYDEVIAELRREAKVQVKWGRYSHLAAERKEEATSPETKTPQ